MTKNTKLRYVLLGLISITLISSLHIWSVPDDYFRSYFTFFAALYGASVILSVVMIVKLKGVWYKVAACLNLSIALLALAYDVFMVLISGIGFMG